MGHSTRHIIMAKGLSHGVVWDMQHSRSAAVSGMMPSVGCGGLIVPLHRVRPAKSATVPRVSVS